MGLWTVAVRSIFSFLLYCHLHYSTIVPKAIHQCMYNMSRTFRKLNPHRHRTHGSGYLADDNLNSAQTRTHLITTVKAKAQPSHHQNPPTPTTHKDQHQHQQPHQPTPTHQTPKNYPNLKQPQPPSIPHPQNHSIHLYPPRPPQKPKSIHPLKKTLTQFSVVAEM